MGAVSPLISIKDRLLERNADADFIWIGTEKGVEKDIIKREGVKYYAIKSAKLRRYFSWEMFVDPFRFVYGFIQAWRILKKFQPDFILSCGGYVSVPVVLAGYFQKKKIIVHQQDLVAGIANKMMAPYATKITVSFDSSLKDFPREKTILIGNPVRQRIFKGDKKSAADRFELRSGMPVVLILGGSLGSEWINNTVYDSAADIVQFCDLIHITGKANVQKKLKISGYHQFEFLHEELADAYAAADLVVARAGLSTLSELSALGKPAIIVPIPDNQQEKNAEYFAEQNAVIYLRQSTTTPDEFSALLKYLLGNAPKLKELSEEIKQLSPENPADKMIDLLHKM